MNSFSRGIALIGCSIALFSGCSKDSGSASSTPSVSGSEAKSVEELTYQFTQTDEDGSCDTGKQSFQNLNRYCLGLQDSVRNSGCAVTQRHQEFDRTCRPIGYRWDDGMECSISILKKYATAGNVLNMEKILSIGDVRFDHIVATYTKCVGPVERHTKRSIRPSGGTPIQNNLGSNVTFDSQFFHEPALDLEFRSHFDAQLFIMISGHAKQFAAVSTRNDKVLTTYGEVPGVDEFYYVSCVAVPFCKESER